MGNHPGLPGQAVLVFLDRHRSHGDETCTFSGISVNSGSEYPPLIDGETTTGFSIFSRSSRTRSQV